MEVNKPRDKEPSPFVICRRRQFLQGPMLLVIGFSTRVLAPECSRLLRLPRGSGIVILTEGLGTEEVGMVDDAARDPIRHVELAVETPGGTWPTEGFFEAPAWQHVERQLKHATRELQIADTSGWESRAEGRKLDVRASFRKNRLEGRVVIRYGPGSSVKPRRTY